MAFLPASPKGLMHFGHKTASHKPLELITAQRVLLLAYIPNCVKRSRETYVNRT